MKRATLTETKNNLSALGDQVRDGETILILDRGRPVAKLESVLNAESASEGRLARLERRGIVRRSSKQASDELLKEAPPTPTKGASALDALLEERRQSR